MMERELWMTDVALLKMGAPGLYVRLLNTTIHNPNCNPDAILIQLIYSWRTASYVWLLENDDVYDTVDTGFDDSVFLPATRCSYFAAAKIIEMAIKLL